MSVPVGLSIRGIHAISGGSRFSLMPNINGTQCLYIFYTIIFTDWITVYASIILWIIKAQREILKRSLCRAIHSNMTSQLYTVWQPGKTIVKHLFYKCRNTCKRHGSKLYMGKWFNWLWPNDAIWRHRSRSKLARVMACCLTAPGHYLIQCWLIFSKVQRHSAEGNLTRDSSPITH